MCRSGERPEPWCHWSSLLKERKAWHEDSVACPFKINQRISESIENGLLPDYFIKEPRELSVWTW